MLVEQPFMRDYTCAQQGSYFRQQQLLEFQLAMEKLKQFPIEKFQRYYEVQGNKVHRWQPVPRFNNRMTSISANPISYINGSLATEGPPYNKDSYLQSRRPVQRNFPKIKKEVSAFGPKHAEHARRFYQSKGTQSHQEFQQVMVPPYRPNYGPMQVSCQRNTEVTREGYLLGEPVFDRSVNQIALCTDSVKGQVPVSVTSQPYETVLKVAKISPRPSEKQPTTTKTGFGVKLVNKKVEQGLLNQSHGSQDSRSEIDLSNAPIFQMLCEISNT